MPLESTSPRVLPSASCKGVNDPEASVRSKPGTDGKFPIFFPTLAVKLQRLLASVRIRRRRTTALPRRQWTTRTLLQAFNELLRPQRTAGVRALPKGSQLRFCLSRTQKLLPAPKRPVLPPSLHVQASIRLGLPTVRRCARPFPLLSPGYEPCPHRIEFGVTQRLPQVCRIQGTRIKPSLPDVPAGSVRRVPVSRIASVRLFQRRRQSFCFARDHHQMDVVRHQAIANQGEGMELHSLPKKIQINHALGVGSQNELSCVATLCDVMGNINHHYTC